MVCRKKDRGGNSGEVPPLSIPNREVKLTCADGTAPPGGRVGSRRPFIEGECPETVRMLPLIAYHPFRIRISVHRVPSSFSRTLRIHSVISVSVPEGCRREALRAVRAPIYRLPYDSLPLPHTPPPTSPGVYRQVIFRKHCEQSEHKCFGFRKITCRENSSLTSPGVYLAGYFLKHCEQSEHNETGFKK